MPSSPRRSADIVNGWADAVRALGVEVKGLWLVDFDNGEGYYCWRYPEDTIGHYHGYEDGFAGFSMAESRIRWNVAASRGRRRCRAKLRKGHARTAARYIKG